jgi:hypothetical protein
MTFKTLEIARKQIEFARNYSLTLLDDVAGDDWFRQPPGAVTHLAWQVGHLAMAEYGLGLFRLRGRFAEDIELMSSRFRKQFSRGSTPDPDPAKNPDPDEIRGVFDRVHRQVMAELPSYTEADLQAKIEEPYAVFDTKLGALYFCSAHEMLHAGQIGLLRRLLGKPPVR